MVGQAWPVKGTGWCSACQTKPTLCQVKSAAHGAVRTGRGPAGGSVLLQPWKGVSNSFRQQVGAWLSFPLLQAPDKSGVGGQRLEQAVSSRIVGCCSKQHGRQARSRSTNDPANTRSFSSAKYRSSLVMPSQQAGHLSTRRDSFSGCERARFYLDF